MAKPKNEPIGECVCPARGCDRTGKVYRFRARPDVTQQRLAGKLYLQCPHHGRFGADGAPAMQDFILENATIWTKNLSASESPSTPAALPPAPPRQTPPAPTITPPPATPARPAGRRDLWEL